MPASGEAGRLLSIELSSGTHRNAPRGDRRELGLLVWRLAVGAPGVEPDETTTTWPTAGLRVEGAVEGRLLGRGRVLTGDGSPLSALAWLNTWLAGDIDGAPPPDPPRDARQGCLVTALRGGLLVHNPDRRSARCPRLVGGGASAFEAEPLAPLETRWLPGGPA
jgi:hypothetical protein